MIVCKRQEPKKTSTVKVLLCCSMSVYEHLYEHALKACYCRSVNKLRIHLAYNRRNDVHTTAAESRMPVWYQRYHVGWFDKAHLTHVRQVRSCIVLSVNVPVNVN